jgi:glutathione-regulated potassium-efflux system ancillary protein KefG
MTDRSPVLILFAHPATQKSRVNIILANAVRRLEGVTLHDLYEAYPDFSIDTKREQQLLLEHDIIVMQFPFFWYSTPALLKEWEDIVLEHGWAYGSKGTALRGKKIMCALSTGGGEKAYQKGGNRFTIRQLLAPLERSATLCGMVFLPPYVVHGTHSLTSQDIKNRAEEYSRLIGALSEGKVNYSKAVKLECCNSYLDRIITD